VAPPAARVARSVALALPCADPLPTVAAQALANVELRRALACAHGEKEQLERDVSRIRQERDGLTERLAGLAEREQAVTAAAAAPQRSALVGANAEAHGPTHQLVPRKREPCAKRGSTQEKQE